MTKNLVPVDTIQVVTKFKNGNIKYKVQALKYEYNEGIYQVFNGELSEYYKNGSIKTEILYDRYGIIIGTKAYDKNGNLYFDRKAIKIDTNAGDLAEFLSSFKHIIAIDMEEEYKYSKQLDKWYLYKKGMRENSKKMGNWVTYKENGIPLVKN